MANYSSAFRVTGTFAPTLADDIACAALAPFADAFSRRPKSLLRALGIADQHTDRYAWMLLTGDRPISLVRFVRLMLSGYNPDSPVAPMQREIVRRALSALAKPFGLSVIVTPSSDTPKGPREELADVTDAAARLHVATSDAIADGVVTDEELAEIEHRAQSVAVEANHVTPSITAALLA